MIQSKKIFISLFQSVNQSIQIIQSSFTLIQQLRIPHFHINLSIQSFALHHFVSIELTIFLQITLEGTPFIYIFNDSQFIPFYQLLQLTSLCFHLLRLSLSQILHLNNNNYMDEYLKKRIKKPEVKQTTNIKSVNIDNRINQIETLVESSNNAISKLIERLSELKQQFLRIRVEETEAYSKYEKGRIVLDQPSSLEPQRENIVSHGKTQKSVCQVQGAPKLGGINQMDQQVNNHEFLKVSPETNVVQLSQISKMPERTRKIRKRI